MEEPERNPIEVSVGWLFALLAAIAPWIALAVLDAGGNLPLSEGAEVTLGWALSIPLAICAFAIGRTREDSSRRFAREVVRAARGLVTAAGAVALAIFVGSFLHDRWVTHGAWERWLDGNCNVVRIERHLLNDRVCRRCQATDFSMAQAYKNSLGDKVASIGQQALYEGVEICE